MAILQLVTDNLRNALTGMGTGRDARTASTYAAPAFLTREQIDAAYRGSGLMRKIITIPALDMVREWRDWKLEVEEITAVEAEEKRLHIRQAIRQAEILRGLGGGAIILGLPGLPEQPAPATITKGQLSFVNVVSRWHLSFDAIQDDATQAGYGEPTMWTMTGTAGRPIRIHPSRVIPFRDDTSASMLSSLSSTYDAFWGDSMVAQVLDAVKDSDVARASFAALLHKARLLRIGIPNLMDIVAAPGGEKLLQDRMAIMVAAESIHNATIFDAGGEEGKGGEQIEDAQYTFAGAKDVLNAYAEFVAAISDIPATRLLGRAPEGMNSSGDSQQKDWNKKVRARQTLDLGPCIDRLDPHLIASALGSVPDSQWYEWAPLDQPTEKETADRFYVQMQAVEKLAALGSVPDRAFNRGVQSLLIDEGYLPELEAALLEIPEDERWGLVTEVDPALDPNDPVLVQQQKGGDPNLAGGGGGRVEAAPLPRAVNDATPRPLYVQRKLLNAADLIAWAKAQGFTSTLPAGDMHVTVLYSRSAVDPMKMGEGWGGESDGGLIIKAGGPRAVERLGESAIVLLFASWSLSSRHSEMIEAGGSHDYGEYQPHVTISYEAPAGLDLEAVKPYAGELRFGPELFEPLDPDWKAKVSEEDA